MRKWAFLVGLVFVGLAVLVFPPAPARAGCRQVWDPGYNKYRMDCTVESPPQQGHESSREGSQTGYEGTPGRTDTGSKTIPGPQGSPGEGSGQGSPGDGPPPPGDRLITWIIHQPGSQCVQVKVSIRWVESGYLEDTPLSRDQVPCPEQKTVQKFCDRLVWTGSRLQCEKGGAFGELGVSVGLPQVVLDFNPYPGAVVGLPVWARMAEGFVSRGEAVLPRVPPDAQGECRGESEDNAGTPPDGTFKDVRLQVSLESLGGAELELPIGVGPDERAATPINRRLWLSETPVTFVFPLPSHPDAGLYGARVVPLPQELDPETARAGTPAFAVRVRAPYVLSYRFSYQQAVGIYKDVEETYCGPDWQEKGCETRKVPHRYGCNWVGHDEGGIIPAEAIEGLPADLLDPAFPTAIMNPNFVARRWDPPTPAGRTEEVASGSTLFWVVREVQSLLGPLKIQVSPR